MDSEHSRRDLLRLCGVVLGGGLAGCASRTDESGSGPATDASHPATSESTTTRPATGKPAPPVESSPSEDPAPATRSPTAADTRTRQGTPSEPPATPSTARLTGSGTETPTRAASTHDGSDRVMQGDESADPSTRTDAPTGTPTATESATTTTTATRTPTETPLPPPPPTASSTPKAGRITYDHDVRSLARRSGRALTAVSGIQSWTATGGSITTTGWRGPGGTSGVRLVSPTKTPHAAARASFLQPLDLSASALSLGMRLNEGAEETVVVRLLAPDEQNQFVLERFLTRQMGTVRLDLAPGQTVGTPDPTDVRGLVVEAATGTQKELDLSVGAPRVRDTSGRQRGAVILSFDDGTHTHYDTAKPIMDEFGFRGVAGIVPWWIGQEGRLTREQLHAMAEDGWEVASHPQIHDAPLSSLSKARQREAIVRAKQWLVGEGFENRAQTLIWPFGKFDTRTLGLIGRYHRFAFGGGSLTAPWAITESGWVPRVTGDEPATLRQAVDMAARCGTVATVMYHTIGEHRISTGAFRNELRYIDRADVDVIMPSQLADAQPY